MPDVRRKKPPTSTAAKKPKPKTPRKKPVSRYEYDEDFPVEIPTEKNVISDRLEDFVTLVYGEKGVGKTSLAAQFDDALVLMFERGRRNLEILQVPQADEPELDWPRFVAYVAKFIDDSRVSTLVIDTIDECYMQCFHFICAQNGVKHPEDHRSGYKIWDEIAAEFAAVLNAIHESGKGLVLLSHCKARDLVNKRNNALTRINAEEDEAVDKSQRLEPTCKPAAFRFLQQICDVVIYYGYRDGERAMTVHSPHNVYWTSAGIEGRFLSPQGEKLQTFLVGNEPKLAYDTLLDAFHNKVYDVDHVATTPVTNTSAVSRALKKRGAKRPSRS